MPRFDVHLYPVFRMTLRNLEAKNHEEALAKGLDEFDMYAIPERFTAKIPGGWELCYAEGLGDSAVVDELDQGGKFGEVKEIRLSDASEKEE